MLLVQIEKKYFLGFSFKEIGTDINASVVIMNDITAYYERTSEADSLEVLKLLDVDFTQSQM